MKERMTMKSSVADVSVTRLSAPVFETAARSIRHSISYLTAGVDVEDRSNVKLIAADLLNDIAEVLDKQSLKYSKIEQHKNDKEEYKIEEREDKNAD